jgi:glycosyltransferase involved in cell wall biosynthesis
MPNGCGRWFGWSFGSARSSTDATPTPSTLPLQPVIGTERANRRVLLVANWDWVLYNFRLPLAAALRRAGYDVFLVCPQGRYVGEMRNSGFEVIDWPLVRRSVNPMRELAAVVRLIGIYRSLQPAVVHHFTIKPNFYGSLAAWALPGCRCPVINTFSGLGFLFTQAARARLARTIVLPLFRLVMRRGRNWSVFHTRSDLDRLVRLGLGDAQSARFIPGSGVDTARFRPGPPRASHIPVVVTGARLLWDKGIGEFVEAARLLRDEGVAAEFWIAGEQDRGNPSCIPSEVIARWQQEGIVRLLGHQRMDEVLARADIAVLPSYHEGVPRFLLESAAAGLPLIATDIEGCRMVVCAGKNGILVPPRRPDVLAGALRTLIADPELRRKYGTAGQDLAERHSEQRIIEQYLRLYQEVCSV